jgi:hypothetical protein
VSWENDCWGSQRYGEGSRTTLSPRDVDLVELVGRFRLVSGGQMWEAALRGQASKTPLDRASLRLTTAG